MSGDGTGVRRHPLFFLGVRHGDLSRLADALLPWRKGRQARAAARAAELALPPGAGKAPLAATALPQPAAGDSIPAGGPPAAEGEADGTDDYYGHSAGWWPSDLAAAAVLALPAKQALDTHPCAAVPVARPGCAGPLRGLLSPLAPTPQTPAPTSPPGGGVARKVSSTKIEVKKQSSPGGSGGGPMAAAAGLGQLHVQLPACNAVQRPLC